MTPPLVQGRYCSGRGASFAFPCLPIILQRPRAEGRGHHRPWSYMLWELNDSFRWMVCPWNSVAETATSKGNTHCMFGSLMSSIYTCLSRMFQWGKVAPSDLMISFIFLFIFLLLSFTLTSFQTFLFVWPKLMCTMHWLFCGNLIVVQPIYPLPSLKHTLFSHKWMWTQVISAFGDWSVGIHTCQWEYTPVW